MGTRSDCRKHKKRKASLNALYYKSRQPKPLATINAAGKLVLVANAKKAASLQPQRLDPTRTGMIRRKWAAEIERRFNRFKKAVRKLIVEENAFGLGRRSVTGNYRADQERDDIGRWVDEGGSYGGVKTSRGEITQEESLALFDRIRSGGFTYQPVDDTMPARGYAVATFRKAEKVFDVDKLTPGDVYNFLVEHATHFDNPKVHAGGWVSDGKVYLDLSTIADSEQEGLSLGVKHDQLGIFDLEHGVTIEVPSQRTRDHHGSKAATSNESAEWEVKARAYESRRRALSAAYWQRANGQGTGGNGPQVNECGAGEDGNPGFQPGNTCAAGDGGSGIVGTGRVRSDGRRVYPGTLPPNATTEAVSKVAADYVEKHGEALGVKPLPPHSPQPLDTRRSREIGKFYEEMPDTSLADPKVRAAYEALASEVKLQYQHMVAAGMRVNFSATDPYPSSKAMIADVGENKNLNVFLTSPESFGPAAVTHDHPLLKGTGIYHGDHELVYNDLFRAVHDYFGHASEGNEFGPVGEERAWLKHSGMFSKLARSAMSMETRGQNSWVNFGPHMHDADGYRGDKRHPRYLAPKDRPYAVQKVGVMPDEWTTATLVDNENCGTGAGGFQPGNTCAKGDGFPMSHGDAVRAGFLFHGMGSQSYRELLESAGFEMGGFSSQPQKLYGPKYIAIKKDAMPLMKFGMDNYQYTGREGREGFVPVKRSEGPDYYAIPFEHIYEADEHGNVLGPLKRPTANVTANRWEALSSSRQLEAFKEWVKQQIILDLLPSDTDESWLGAYIKFAYQRGLARVFEDMRPQDDKTLDFYKGTKQEFLKSAFGRPVSQERVKLLTARTYNDLQGITDAMSAKLSRVLTDGMIQGKSPRDVARDIDKEIDGIGRARALTMARTETIRAHSEGQLDAMEAQGIDEAGVAVEWSTSEMGVTAKGNPSPCDRCAPMAGVVLKVKESHGLIPLHPNAVFEGSTFVPYGDAHEIVRARYDGPAIVLRATDGLREYRTTIGPNHPMFSRLGLVKAAQLREGDEILYDRRHDPSFSSDVDHEQIPAIENVFESLLGDIANIHIASASSDLHGDRVFCHGEVEAIRPARSLLLVWDALGFEQLRKENLVWADAEPSLASSDGPLSLGRSRIRRAASRLVSAGNNSRAFGSRHLREPELGGVALASPGNAGVSKASIHDTARASELFGNRLGRQPSVVHRRDLLGRDIEHGPFLWLKVTEVVESHFSGWAFDATTASSLYCNSGFVVKNCMCSWIPANVGEDTKDQIRTKSRIQKAIQASLDAEGVEDGEESDWEGQDLKLDKDRPKPLE